MKKLHIIAFFVVFFYQKAYAQKVAANTDIDIYGAIKQYYGQF